MNRQLLLLLFFLLCVSIPHIATAQYMYLDTNGDGLSTAADQISPSGPTTLDVWVRTNTNRDGSPATCVTEDGDLTINSYEFILHATGGTVSWSGFTNHQADFNINLGHGESGTDYHNGQGGGVILSPGTYRLASITVGVTLGSPSIAFASSSPLSGVFLTSFGSRCSGNDFDNTLKLGSDWFDTDGAPFGGAANQPPVLTPPADMTVSEGAVAEQELQATDPEAQPLSFGLVSGPEYATVSTVDPGTGQARGLVRLTPGLRDNGVTSATVRATDGLLEDAESFTITVTDVNTAPSLEAIPNMTVVEGDFQNRPLSATDAESDPLTFSLLVGPSYVTVTSNFGSGQVSVTPAIGNAGEADATVQVSDGLLTDTATFHVTVLLRFPVHNQILCPPEDMLIPSGTTQEQGLQAISPDGAPIQFLLLSGPAFVTVSTTSSNPANATGVVRAAPGPSDVGAFPVTVAATDGIATDSKTFTLAVGDARALPDPANPLYVGQFQSYRTGVAPQSMAAADLDGDGDLDLVTANLLGSLSILRGEGDGRFSRGDDYPLLDDPYSVAIADLNGDDRPDLAVTDSALNVVSIIEAIGECQFGRRVDLPTLARPAHVKLADWTGDGAADLVISNEGAESISFFRGRGNGTFDPPSHHHAGVHPTYADDGDFNGDGHRDIAVANFGSNDVSILLGNGDGTFQEHVTYLVGSEPRSVEAGDLNGDGHLDLATANRASNTLSVLLGVGNGTFLTHSEYPVGTFPWGIAIGDLNGDGNADIATADLLDDMVSVLLGNGSGAYPVSSRLSAGLGPRSVLLAETNGDGFQDLLVAGQIANAVNVFLGMGDGQFPSPTTYPTRGAPYDLASGDWNGDGLLDVLVSSNGLQVFFNMGGGVLQAGPSSPPSEPAADIYVGDWDGDGVPDVATEHQLPTRVILHRGSTDGTFTDFGELAISGFIFDAVTTDLGTDGDLDLVFAVAEPNAIHIFDNAGDGSFVARSPLATQGEPTCIRAGDWNGDGRADLAVGIRNPDRIVPLLAGPAGELTPGAPIPLTEDPITLATADFNGDAIPDVAVGWFQILNVEIPFATFDAGLEVRLGHGDGTFGAPHVAAVEPIPFTIYPLDANGDGRWDLAVHTATSSIGSVLLGLGNGDFAPKSDFGSAGGVNSLQPVELTGDGRVDLALSDLRTNRLVISVNRGTFPVVPNDAPVANAGGPYSGMAGLPVSFDGTASSDPDGQALSMAWNFGDGTSAKGSGPVHTFEEEGVFPVVLTVSDGIKSHQSATTATIASTLAARAFTTPDSKTLRLFGSKPSFGIRLEPENGSFELNEVDVASVRLRSVGTGSVEEVPAISEKATPLADRDKNGVEELQLNFSTQDLRLLFASITGTSDVPVSLDGALTDGRHFHADATLRVIGAPGFPAAFVAPNPVNPAATLFVATSKAGHLRATLYDAAGRKVRVIADHAATQPGVHELRFEGRTDQGTDLPSGIYFYRVESSEGTTNGRVSILK